MVSKERQRSSRWFQFLLVSLLAGALLLGGAVSATAQGDDGAFSEDVVTATTTANLNLRDAPGLHGSILATLPAGTTVGFTGFMDGTGDWVQVDSEGNPVGWVVARFLSDVPEGLQVRPADAVADGTAQNDVAEDVFSGDVVTAMTTVNLNLRDAPSLDSSILDTLPAGSVVGFTGFTDDTGAWIQVDAESYPVGWVAGRFLSAVPAELQVRPADVETEPGDTAEAAGEVAADVFGEDVVTATTTVNLNLRDAPRLDAAVLNTLPAGSVVGFTGFMDATGDWVQVDAEGYPVGWVAARFLSDVPAGLTVWEPGS